MILTAVSFNANSNEIYEIVPPPSYEQEKARVIAEEEKRRVEEARMIKKIAEEEARKAEETMTIKRLAEEEARKAEETMTIKRLAEEKLRKEQKTQEIFDNKYEENKGKEVLTGNGAKAVKHEDVEKSTLVVASKDNVVVNNNIKDNNVQYSQPRVSVNKNSYFSAEKNEMLSTVLKRWAKQEGWTLHWSYPNDFILPANINTTGTIENVFRKVGESLISEKIDLGIKLYRSNQVIVIK